MLRPIEPADEIVGPSPIVTMVFDRVLAEILGGTRPAGSVIRDLDIARQLGVSRTPVREALQTLRNAGVIEVLASRSTRVAVLTPQDIEDAGRVSLLLYGGIIAEVAAGDIPVPLAALEAEQAAARASIDEPTGFLAHCFRFHDLIVQLSPNPHLIRAIDASVHALRLALLSNVEVLDFEAILLGQQRIVDGLARRDPQLAGDGVSTLRGLGDRLPVPSAG